MSGRFGKVAGVFSDRTQADSALQRKATSLQEGTIVKVAQKQAQWWAPALEL